MRLGEADGNDGMCMIRSRDPLHRDHRDRRDRVHALSRKSLQGHPRTSVRLVWPCHGRSIGTPTRVHMETTRNDSRQRRRTAESYGCADGAAWCQAEARPPLVRARNGRRVSKTLQTRVALPSLVPLSIHDTHSPSSFGRLIPISSCLAEPPCSSLHAPPHITAPWHPPNQPPARCVRASCRASSRACR